MNEYGLDTNYFTDKLTRIIRDISRYRPSELARELLRMSLTADDNVIKEKEFTETNKNSNSR
jgi:hypothetical protein